MTKHNYHKDIIVNIRNLSAQLTGVQRYTAELVSRLANHIDTISPPKQVAEGYAEHAWEKLMLPQRVARNLLWSPANIGPLLFKKQVISIRDLCTIELPEG